MLTSSTNKIFQATFLFFVEFEIRFLFSSILLNLFKRKRGEDSCVFNVGALWYFVLLFYCWIFYWLICYFLQVELKSINEIAKQIVNDDRNRKKSFPGMCLGYLILFYCFFFKFASFETFVLVFFVFAFNIFRTTPFVQSESTFSYVRFPIILQLVF